MHAHNYQPSFDQSIEIRRKNSLLPKKYKKKGTRKTSKQKNPDHFDMEFDKKNSSDVERKNRSVMDVKDVKDKLSADD